MRVNTDEVSITLETQAERELLEAALLFYKDHADELTVEETVEITNLVSAIQAAPTDED